MKLINTCIVFSQKYTSQDNKIASSTISTSSYGSSKASSRPPSSLSSPSTSLTPSHSTTQDIPPIFGSVVSPCNHLSIQFYFSYISGNFQIGNSHQILVMASLLFHSNLQYRSLPSGHVGPQLLLIAIAEQNHRSIFPECLDLFHYNFFMHSGAVHRRFGGFD